MKGCLLVLTAAALLVGCHEKSAGKPAANAPAANRPTLRIAATGNVWGQVEPCG